MDVYKLMGRFTGLVIVFAVFFGLLWLGLGYIEANLNALEWSAAARGTHFSVSVVLTIAWLGVIEMTREMQKG